MSARHQRATRSARRVTRDDALAILLRPEAEEIANVAAIDRGFAVEQARGSFELPGASFRRRENGGLQLSADFW